MIARPLLAPAEPQRARGWRAARNASAARRVRQRRLRYRLIGRTLVLVGMATVVVLAYLALMANITRLHYEIGNAKRVRAQLASATARNDDEIARLTARDRLSAIAMRLGMREADSITVVSLPPPRHRVERPAHGVAFLSSMAGWFK